MTSIKKFLQIELRTWPHWWNSLTTNQRAFPAGFVVTYWSTLSLLKGLRADHVKLGAVILALSYFGKRANRLRTFVLPFIVTGIVYDSQRFWAKYVRSAIRVSELYLFDKKWFGIQTSAGLFTPNEFWQIHTYPFLDFVTGTAYLSFFVIFILQGAYYYFGIAPQGNTTYKPHELQGKATRMIWGFFLLNIMGFATYYVFPASPPWYVSMYGLGPARVDIPSNPAGAARFDQLLGVNVFHDMYSKAADDLHGAMPSLHVAYPLMAALYAFQFGKLRAFSVGFYLLMCFSAIYLNHHYITDVVFGSLYAVTAVLFLENFVVRYFLKNSI